MFRTQPPGFRWLVGGFALLAGLAFLMRYHGEHDKGALVLGVLSLAVAGYWLIVDRWLPTDVDPDADNAGSADSVGNRPPG